MNKIFPNVVSLRVTGGQYVPPKPLKCCFLSEKVNVFADFKHQYEIIHNQNEANIIYSVDENLKDEAYRLIISDGLVEILYSKPNGAFYATKTLDQILDNTSINNLEIYDEPAIKVRGFMLDISRDKVSTVSTIKQVIDLMARLKMNHFELYVEGFSFEYKSFKHFLEEDGYITVEEYLEIEKYANERFIDFVPNQNGFGHMAKWLATDEYQDLAVCPGGMMMWGRWRKPNTLDPHNEKSIALVKKMYADMIPLASSKYFNMNFDEPFELGHGKSEGMVIEDIYINYTLKAYEEVKKYGKIPLIWADVLIKHPTSWQKIPNDMIFIDWGYDGNYPFGKHAKMLKEKKMKFMTAPGTTSWCSFFGRYLDWYENIKNACDAVYHHNGEGVLLTDWGDFGHLQFLPISFAPIVYMGLYSWSYNDGVILSVREYLNKYIFGDKNQVIGDLLLDLGNSYRYEVEYTSNGTKTFYTFMWACAAITDTLGTTDDPISYFKKKMGTSTLSYSRYEAFENFLNWKLQELHRISLAKDDQLVKLEIVQGIKIVKMIHKLSVAYDTNLVLKKRLGFLEDILKEKDQFIEDQKAAWLARNKSGGLKSSLSYIECFMEFVLRTLNYLSEEESKNEKNEV